VNFKHLVKNKKVLAITGLLMIVLFTSGAIMAAASEKQMTGTELKQLLESGITLKLGGEGEGYEGDLVLLPDGTGKGQAITDKGEKIILEGTWEIDGDEFCRVWEGLTNGESVCERWIVIGENKVEVRRKDKKSGKYKKAGINSW
jgi:hypothetical protein